jgi:PAS domain S-box-containing protein
MVQDACTLATKESIQKTLRTEDLQCRYYEAIVNTTTDLIAITDGQRILDANKSLVELCEGIGLNVFDKSFSISGLFVPIQKFGYIYDGYQDLPWYAHVEKKKNSDCRVGIMVDGALYTYNLTLRPLEVFTGIYVMTLSDVTEMMGYKTTLEEGIKSSAKDRDKTQFMLQQYDKAMEAATMVFKCDLEGVITYSNRALCEALAYANGELIGKHLLTLRGKSVTDQTYATIWDRVTKGKIYRGVLELSDKLGGSHYLDVSLVPILDPQKQIIEYFSLSHEITDAIEAKEAAIRTLEAKNKFFDQASHELRTPLNAIVNFTDSALESFDEMFLDEESKELVKMYIQRAHSNSQHLLELINSLLEIAKLRAGKETFTMVECDAVELAKGVYHSVLALNTNPDVDFDFEFPHEHLMIRCDVLKMRQVLLNLVSNALKFTPKGSVVLRIYTIDEMCRIEVEDTGVGIPQNKIEKIFEPFEQVSHTDKGTGLGLGIVHEYVKGMKMRLVVSSKEGLGSIFVVNAPLVAITTQS